MNKTVFALLGFGAVMAIGAGGGSASAMPLAALSSAESGPVVQVYHQGQPHRASRKPRQRIVVYPPAYGPPAHSYWVPYPDYNATYRGFDDPGFALRGNMPGCAVDLGYGRWEPCN